MGAINNLFFTETLKPNSGYRQLRNNNPDFISNKIERICKNNIFAITSQFEEEKYIFECMKFNFGIGHHTVLRIKDAKDKLNNTKREITKFNSPTLSATIIVGSLTKKNPFTKLKN